MKKILIFVTAIVIIVAGILIFRDNYVYLHQGFEKRKEDTIHVHLDSAHVNELNRCTDVKHLCTYQPSNEKFSQLITFEKLEKLEMHNPKYEISHDGMNFINKQPKLNRLSFLEAETDLNGINNNSIQEILISLCSVKNFKSIENCSSLISLTISKTKIDGCISFDDANNKEKENRYSLIDSSVFSSFDTIEKLEFKEIFLEDISGLLDMDSLKTFIIKECYISNENLKELEDKGIKVVVL